MEESPPQGNGYKPAGTNNGAARDSSLLFSDLRGCNVGFKAFHPVPVTQHGDALVGRAEMGGVWEWTSSVLERWEGFKPMDAYPLYTGWSAYGCYTFASVLICPLTWDSRFLRRQAQYPPWGVLGYASSYCRQEELVSCVHTFIKRGWLTAL